MSTYYNCYKVAGYDGVIFSHAGNMDGDGSCLVHHFVLDWILYSHSSPQNINQNDCSSGAT